MKNTTTSSEDSILPENFQHLFGYIEPHLQESLRYLERKVIELKILAVFFFVLGISVPATLIFKTNITTNAFSWAPLISIFGYFFGNGRKTFLTSNQFDRQKIASKKVIGVWKFAVESADHQLLKELADDIRKESADANKAVAVDANSRGGLSVADLIGYFTKRFHVQQE